MSATEAGPAVFDPFEDGFVESPYDQYARLRDGDPVHHSKLLHGWVVSTPQFFVMARPVDSAAQPACIVNPWHRFPPEACDTWHIYLAAGDLRAALAWLPHPLPKIAFERRNILRYYRLESLAQLIARRHVSSARPTTDPGH